MCDLALSVQGAFPPGLHGRVAGKTKYRFWDVMLCVVSRADSDYPMPEVLINTVETKGLSTLWFAHYESNRRMLRHVISTRQVNHLPRENLPLSGIHHQMTRVRVSCDSAQWDPKGDQSSGV